MFVQCDNADRASPEGLHGGLSSCLSFPFCRLPLSSPSSMSEEKSSENRSEAGSLDLDAALLAQGLADDVGGAAALAAAGGEDVGAHLAHADLLLHGDDLLLLGPAQGKGHADQQGGDGDGPHGAAGEEDDALDDAVGGLVLVPEPGASGRRDDVAQGRDALGEGLLRRVVVGVVGDFRVCGAA